MDPLTGRRDLSMKLSETELKYFICQANDLLQHEKLNEMKKYIQHGNTSTYNHCMTVAYYSYAITRRLPFKLDTRSIIRGALLHDFYLYDWHIPDDSHKMHGFVHPGFALKNSRRYFRLNRIEEDIIEKHMWPLTLTQIPLYKEALLVCLVDKYCSLAETLYIPIFPNGEKKLKHLFSRKSYIVLSNEDDGVKL
jgi:uncharacterized protein